MSESIEIFTKPFVVESARTRSTMGGIRTPVSWEFVKAFYSLEEAREYADYLSGDYEFVRVFERGRADA